MQLELLNKVSISGTYYVEFQLSESDQSKIEHWKDDSKFCIPEVLELVYPTIKAIHLNIDFFGDNIWTSNDCQRLISHLDKLNSEIDSMDLTDLQNWLSNHEFSDNFLNEYDQPIDTTLKSAIVKFIGQLLSFFDTVVHRQQYLRILGV